MTSYREIHVSDQEREHYERERSALLVPDPWKDKFCQKTGLVGMYIESSMAEIMHLRAESEPGVKLNVPNPVYVKFHELLATTLKVRDHDAYSKLQTFIENEIVKRPLQVVKWSGYVPDIRLVDTIDEALGWLQDYLEC